MRLASFRTADGRSSFGVVDADGSITDLGTPEVPTLRAALGGWGVDGIRSRAKDATRRVAAGSFAWLPPVTDPDKILVVGLKYLILLMRADNRGEGGILSLVVLVETLLKKKGGVVLALGIIGAAFFFGDAMITLPCRCSPP